MSDKTNDAKYRIVSRLLNGELAHDIAKSEETSYAIVMRHKRELKLAQENDSLHELLNIDKALLNDLLETIKAKVPTELKDLADDVIDGITRSANTLEVLSIELQLTAQAINKRIRSTVLVAQHASDIDSLTESLCKLQNAFFNKSTTQVNVQNNYDSAGNHRFTDFTGDAPIQVEQVKN